MPSHGRALTAAGLIAAAVARTAVGLEFLAYASPLAATSHQLAIRRIAEALAEAGHAVTLLEPEAALVRLGEPTAAGNLSVVRVELMADADYSARFNAGESYQSLSQEVNAQLLPKALRALSSRHFDLAVVDALYPLLAKDLHLPSLHVQCASDPDAASAAWFHHGLSGSRQMVEVVRNARFVALWLLSWLFVGTHQDSNSSGTLKGLSWGVYFRTYVRAVALQGTPQFALPSEAAIIAAANPSRVFFVGSLTARPLVPPPSEAPEGKELALVAFGTHNEPCPEHLLQALGQLGLMGIVLVESCRGVQDLPPGHLLPTSRDQAAWLRAKGMRLAVVHGGIHSLQEATAAGLPVACVPHRGDQWANCRDLQRQRLGWAIHPRAPVEEAAASLRHLLGGSFTPAPAAEALAAAGGAAGAARLAVRLAEGLGEDMSSRPWPFFAAPWRWAEGWLLLLGTSLPLLSMGCIVVSCCCSAAEVIVGEDSEAKAKAE